MSEIEKKSWLIQEYDSLNLVASYKLSTVFGEGEIEAILQRLASRYLTGSEIISASKRKNMKGYSPHLHVKRENRNRVIMSVGSNPHFIASLHTDEEFNDIDLLDLSK